MLGPFYWLFLWNFKKHQPVPMTRHWGREGFPRGGIPLPQTCMFRASFRIPRAWLPCLCPQIPEYRRCIAPCLRLKAAQPASDACTGRNAVSRPRPFPSPARFLIGARHYRNDERNNVRPEDTKGGKPPGKGALSKALPKDCLWFPLNSIRIIASGADAASAYARSASSDAAPMGPWMSCTGLWPAASGAATVLPSVPRRP